VSAGLEALTETDLRRGLQIQVRSGLECEQALDSGHVDRTRAGAGPPDWQMPRPARLKPP